MSDQPRRRLRPPAAPRRVGEPNVLTGQATPNQLSTMGTTSRPTPPAMAPTQAATRPLANQPAIPAGMPPRPPSEATPAAGPRVRRLPSLSTLIFIGFLLFTAARFLGNAGFGFADPTTPPGSAGVVTFGTSLDEDCALTQPGNRFARIDDVWWRADLAATQGADAATVVRMYHDEDQIERHDVPAEPNLGEWDVLCAAEPVAGRGAGEYRVEVWDAPEQQLLATGTYTRFDATP